MLILHFRLIFAQSIISFSIILRFSAHPVDMAGDERGQRQEGGELVRVQRKGEREGEEEARKDIHLARGQEGHACLEIGMR